MFWHIIAPAYSVAWFFSSLLFTRHFFNHYTFRCTSECVNYGFHSSRPVTHSDDCRSGKQEWRHEPLPPGEAMFLALFFPFFILYGVMLWNHLRTPFALRTRIKAPRTLTAAELKKLDEILFNQKETA